jgi:uncharacterized membrane protein YfbV (UPF0208 family)
LKLPNFQIAPKHFKFNDIGYDENNSMAPMFKILALNYAEDHMGYKYELDEETDGNRKAKMESLAEEYHNMPASIHYKLTSCIFEVAEILQVKGLKKKNWSSWALSHELPDSCADFITDNPEVFKSIVPSEEYEIETRFHAYHTARQSSWQLAKSFLDFLGENANVILPASEIAIMKQATSDDEDIGVTQKTLALIHLYVSMYRKDVGRWYQGERAAVSLNPADKARVTEYFRKMTELKSDVSKLSVASTMKELNDIYTETVGEVDEEMEQTATSYEYMPRPTTSTGN